ncbi:o-succinylbenzoate synthase [Microbacterium sp. YY-01]|uniref:o-succinylbenzoate synthase n=1 Tax=Microbacterium sp. YY-01 TaxID=3421634 RepID=UPI003D177001
MPAFSPATPPTMTLDDLVSAAHVVALPMNTRFRGVTVREAVVFEGPYGWAEFSPFVEYDDREAAVWLQAAMSDATQPRPHSFRDSIRVNATVPAVAAQSVPDVLARFDGCRTAKVKVAERGQNLDDDIARVAAVREVMGPAGRIRIDANGGWSVDEAERAISRLVEYDLEYVEQPCASVPELAAVRARIHPTGILIAADESVRKAADPLAVARAEAADLLVIKAQPLGGIDAALRIVAEAGLPVVVSSALDTAVGLSLGAGLAASLPQLAGDCGLGTAALMADDLAPARPIAGYVSTQRVIPDAAALRRLAAPADRRQWWLDRVRRCYAVLSQRG